MPAQKRKTHDPYNETKIAFQPVMKYFYETRKKINPIIESIMTILDTSGASTPLIFQSFPAVRMIC